MEAENTRSSERQRISGIESALMGMMRKPIAQEGDYVKDGLLHCGKCNTPKQIRFKCDIGKKEPLIAYPAVPCECKQKEIDRQAAEEKARKARERIELLRSKGISDTAWLTARFENDDRRDPNASDVCVKYVNNFEKMSEHNIGLMLFGEIGCGKTYLAACIANALIDRGINVIMASLHKLIYRMNADFGSEKNKILEQIRTVDLLILDDIGTERQTDYMIGEAYTVINTRYDAKLPLVATTNLLPKEFLKADSTQPVGIMRIFDRFNEMCSWQYVAGGTRRNDIGHNKQMKFKEILGDSQ